MSDRRAPAEVGTTAVVTTVVAKSEQSEAPKELLQEEAKEQAEPEKQVVPVPAAVALVDSEEKQRLTNEIAALREEIEKNNGEILKYKEELAKGKENILNLEEEVSHLGKEKARFEKQATDNKQVCKAFEQNDLM